MKHLFEFLKRLFIDLFESGVFSIYFFVGCIRHAFFALCTAFVDIQESHQICPDSIGRNSPTDLITTPVWL